MTRFSWPAHSVGMNTKTSLFWFCSALLAGPACDSQGALFVINDAAVGAEPSGPLDGASGEAASAATEGVFDKPGPLKSLSAGRYHSCAVAQNGSLWCWGADVNWQQALDGKVAIPKQIGTSTSWATVSAAGTGSYEYGLDPDSTANGVHACAIRQDGTLWCWGGNGSGQLGDGTTIDKISPTRVPVDGRWKSVDSSGFHTCAVREEGTLWCWGRNWSFELGDGTNLDRRSPIQVGTSADWVEVSTGGYGEGTSGFTCAVNESGALWCWGDNRKSQLGSGRGYAQKSPVQVNPSTIWRSVEVGGAHGCAIAQDGSTWCWGGFAGSRPTLLQQSAVVKNESWSVLSSGLSTSCGVRQDGTLWCRDGTLARQVEHDTDWAAVTVGTVHQCGLRKDGSAWCWGSNYYGQLGNGSSPQKVVPSLVMDSNGWSSVTAGYSHACAIQSGSLWCWGELIGVSGSSSPAAPVQIGTGWHSVSRGISACGIRQDQSLWCWGSISAGDVGDRGTLVPVGGDRKWTLVTSSGSHNCALSTDGSVWCWGANSRGQLGDGSSLTKSTPTRIATFTDWVDVTAGPEHTCAVAKDRSLWCWGRIAESEWTLPSRVGDENDWIKARAGGGRVCALKENQSLWCWGASHVVRLGNSNSLLVSSDRPVQVGQDSQWIDVSLGSGHICASRADHTLWCWGDNDYGQLGNGTRTGSPDPKQVGSETWRSVTLGYAFTCAIRATQTTADDINVDGTLWCWGANHQGQSGDGSGSSPAPVRVKLW